MPHARTQEGGARTTWAHLACLSSPTVRDVFGPGLVLVFVYHLIFREFFPTPRGVMGHDYLRHLPWLLAGYFWLRTNGPFAVPWAVPSFCGGVPFYPDPENMYYSVAQWLTLIMDPLAAVYWQFLLMAWLGFAGFYVLLRLAFVSSRPAALLGAAVFMFNGFYAHRMLIGHVPFHAFMLLPWVAFFVLRPTGESAERNWRTAGSVVCAALILAYMLQSGMVHAWVPVLLAIVVLGLLRELWIEPDALFWARLLGAVALALALAASKLSAAAAYVAQFPRAAYPIPGVAGVAALLKVLTESLFLGPTENTESAIVNTQWILGRHEFEYGVTFVPALMIAAAALRWLGNARRRKLTLPCTRTVSVWVGLAALLCLPAVLNYYEPALHQLLKQIPIIRSTSTFLRWFCVYIPVLALGGALAMDSITSGRGLKIVVAGISIGACVAVTAIADREYYRAQPYSPERVRLAYTEVHRGRQIPPIVSIGDRRYGNDALALGVSPIGCYLAIFGYRLELFPLQALHAGPALADHGGQLNVKNPACYWLPAENGCRPGDHFTSEQRRTAAEFLVYGPTEFQWSIRQEVANRVNLAALFGCIAFALGYALRAVGVVR